MGRSGKRQERLGIEDSDVHNAIDAHQQFAIANCQLQI
jgi:hypothetical protein